MSDIDYNTLTTVPTRTSHAPVRTGPSTGEVVREIVETLLLTFFIFWLVNSMVGRYRIDGSSMNPTLYNEQYLIINNLSYLLDDPQRGEIIVFRHPRSDMNLIKRVIGIPGDEVEVRDRQVYVNGVLVPEPYIQEPTIYEGSWSIPDDQYFVLGDNRNNSNDSHNWQYLPRDHILGKAILIYWPVTDWGMVTHHALSLSEPVVR
jgi:signal peptidase I